MPTAAVHPSASRARASESRVSPTVTTACLTVILLIGGAGTAYPMVIAAGTLVAIALCVFSLGWRRVRLDPLEWVLVALAIAVPLVQLVPLPPSIWGALPGHQVAAQTLSAAGLASQPMPLSLDPAATVSSLFALIPGIAMLIAGRSLDESARMTVLRALLLAAACSAMLGAVQIVLGDSAYSPSFVSAHRGQGIGLFTNRNHQATLLLVALCLLPAARWTREGRSDPLVAAGLAILFIAGVLATSSRMALLLLPLVLVVAGWRYRRRGWVVMALLLVACLALALLAWWQGALPRGLARFDVASDLRFTFWRTSLAALSDWWPTGSGMGSFTLVYPLVESRADLSPYFVNHAHQDYLELLLEAGIAGALGLALFALWYVRRVAAAARSASAERIGACWAIFILLLFSAVDYPLRMLSLMALFGLLCALAGPPAGDASDRQKGIAAAIGGLVGLMFAAAALAGGWAEHQRLAGQAEAAVRFNPYDHAAHTDVAAQAYRDRRYGDARAAAGRALRLVPVDQRTLTILALALREDGEAEHGRRALLAAAALGWRDPSTQTWLIATYGEAGQMAEAAARADAQLRQERTELIPILRTVMADPGFVAAFARVVAAGPSWRRDYLTRLDDLQPPQLAAHRALLALLPNRTPDEDRAYIARAIALGDIAGAQSIWRASAAGGLADPGFTRIDRGAALLGWQRTALDGLEATTEHGQTSFRVDGGTSGRILFQDLMLPPGNYRFTFAFSADAPVPANLFAWTLNCVEDGRRADAGTIAGRDRVTLLLAIPATGCPVQRLSLHLGGTAPGDVLLRTVKSSLDFVSRSGPASTPN